MNIDSRISFDHARIGSVRLHFAKAGEGAQLVLLLHGFPEFWYSWRHQIAALADSYTVVAPDLRGYNLSDKPQHAGEYRLNKLADDIIGLVDHFGREKAAVIGHDWGASIAWTIAQNNPEYLWKVGALQVPPRAVWLKNLTVRQLLASWYIFFFQLPGLPEFVLRRNDFAALKKVLRETTVEKDIFTDEDIAVYREAWDQPFALTAMVNYYRVNFFDRFFLRPGGGNKITVPTLFIYGQQDSAILPETVRNIGEFVDAPFEEYFVPLSGHWVQQEAAEAVNQLLLEFLAK